MSDVKYAIRHKDSQNYLKYDGGWTTPNQTIESALLFNTATEASYNTHNQAWGKQYEIVRVEIITAPVRRLAGVA